MIAMLLRARKSCSQNRDSCQDCVKPYAQQRETALRFFHISPFKIHDMVRTSFARLSGSLPVNPSHMIFHVINSTEDPLALVVRAWNTRLVLDAASQRGRPCDTGEKGGTFDSCLSLSLRDENPPSLIVASESVLLFGEG